MNTITPEQLRSELENTPEGTYAIVDVRSPEEHQREHIAGSINMPLDTVVEHSETLREYDRVYLYCQSGNRSGQACARLHDVQLPNVTSIEGGLPQMKQAGFDIVTGKGPLPLQQQVLLGAGLIVLTGIVLSVLVHPWFLIIPFGAGAGLTYAGLSGNCMMAKVLQQMPWNRNQ